MATGNAELDVGDDGESCRPERATRKINASRMSLWISAFASQAPPRAARIAVRRF